MPIPEFVLQLRALVGNGLLWLPGVTGVIRDGAGRILLARRSDNGRWALISGIIEPGEQPADCIVREAREEAGIDINVDALVYVRSGTPVSYPNGDVSQYLDLTFLCTHVGGVARVADEESTDVGWFALDDLPAQMSASSRERLAEALAYLADPGPAARFLAPGSPPGRR